MSPYSITIRHTVFINRPREMVWDFTQNYDNRKKWDKSVLEVHVLQSTPQRMVGLKTQGNTSMTFVYKLDDRPNKTTLAAKDIQSKGIEACGGSWMYQEQNGGTLWTQTNSIILKKSFLSLIFLPLYKWLLVSQTKAAMEKAKTIMELM